MQITNIAIDKLNPAKYNPRLDLKPEDKEYQDIKRSIVEFGLVEPLVINKGNIIVGGHQRYKVLKELNFTTVPCITVDLDKQKEKMLNISLNKISGGWDRIKLKDILEELDSGEYDITLTGWGEQEIEDLMTEFHVEPEEDDFDVDKAVEEIKEPICKRGDIWQLGEHRLMCGDATVEEDVKKLMDGKKADISFTSPPYNVGVNAILSPHQKMGAKYINDKDNKSNDKYLKLLTQYTLNSLEISEYIFINIQSIAGNKLALIDFLYEMKKYYADTIIWDKLNAQPAMAENVLNSQFEYIHIFSHKANRSIGTKKFRGTLSNIIDIPKQTANKIKEHNATFSIPFASFFINNFSIKSVADLFGGSGSTLIACEQLNRKCYMAEIDPVYIQVILERYIKYKGTSDDVFLLKDGKRIPYKEIF